MNSRILNVMLKYTGNPYKAIQATNEILEIIDEMHDDSQNSWITDEDEQEAIQYLKDRCPNQEEWHYRDAVMVAGLSKFNNTNQCTVFKTKHDVFLDVAFAHLKKLEEMSKKEG